MILRTSSGKLRRDSGIASNRATRNQPSKKSSVLCSYAPMHHYFPCKWRGKNLPHTNSFPRILGQLSCTCARKRSQYDHISIQCTKRHRRQLVQSENFAPHPTEMYLAPSGTFLVAGHEVCQVSPCPIQSTLSDQRKEARLGLIQL